MRAEMESRNAQLKDLKDKLAVLTAENARLLEEKEEQTRRIREQQQLASEADAVEKEIRRILDECITIDDLAYVSPYDGVYGF